MTTDHLLFALLFIITWLVYLVLQAFLVVGIKLGASGKTEILPDGTEKDSEMLLYPIAKFLLKTVPLKIFYSGEQLGGLLEEMETFVSNLAKNLKFNGDHVLMVNGLTADNVKTVQASVEQRFGIKMIVNDVQILFYKEINKFTVPVWLRKPIIECVICMASFWGLFMCLLPGLFVFGFLNWKVYVFYVVNTVALGAMNKLVANHVKLI